jgi:hypothetical protein
MPISNSAPIGWFLGGGGACRNRAFFLAETEDMQYINVKSGST